MKRSLSYDEVIQTLTGYFSGSSQASLATSMNISEKAIYNILYQKTYREHSQKFITKNFSSQEDYHKFLEHRRKKGLGRKL